MINCIILLNVDIKDDVVMAKQPIVKFKDEEELIKVCQYYQHKLFLDNWTIKFKFDTDIADDYGN